MTLEASTCPELARPRSTGSDPFSADRFTVDLAEWGEPGASPADTPGAPRTEQAPPACGWAHLLRLTLVVVLSLVAFHHSLGSLFRSVASGSVVAYVLAVPLFAGLALAAVLRRRERPPVRVGRADVVGGALVCAFALVASASMGPSLSGVFPVWRLDLLMLWVFLVGAGTITFGARQVVRSWAFWAVLLLVWPFPVRLVNASAGSANGGAVLLGVVVLAVLAYGYRPGDGSRLKVLATAAAPAIVLVVASGIASHPQRIVWPPVAVALVGASWWLGRAHGAPHPHAVPDRRVRGTVGVLVALCVAGLVVLPAAPRPASVSRPTGITSLALGPFEPPGWALMSSERLGEQRFFGAQSVWLRMGLRQGIPGVGPVIGGRDIVVDVVTTPRPQTLELYPVVTTYAMGTLSTSPAAEVDLGHSVEGDVYRAYDSRAGIAYTLLTFTWQLPVDTSIFVPYQGPPAPLTQRVTMIAVDDHQPDAVFPLPGNATLDGVGTILASHGELPSAPQGHLEQDDVALLGESARQLVDQRLTAG